MTPKGYVMAIIGKYRGKGGTPCAFTEDYYFFVFHWPKFRLQEL